MSTSTTPGATPVKKEPSPPSIITNTSRIPSTGYSNATSLSSSFEPLSSSEILERVPSPVVRLVAALGPAIHAFHRLIRLATWTGGKGSTSSSMLMLVTFWLACAFGYELLRYAPQLLVLGWIGYAGIRRQLAFAKPRTHTPAKLLQKQDVVSAATINATLLELSEIADFFSAVRSNVLVPAVQMVSWDPSPMTTKAVALFLILTWPLWLLAFLPLRESGFPSLVLPVSGAGILAFVHHWATFVYHQLLRLIGPDLIASFHAKATPLYSRVDHASAFLAKTPVPLIWAKFVAIVARVRWEQWTDFNLTLLPPYPIGALSVRSLVCFVGTLALTWCSPWCALFRQAVWKSATIRRFVRGTGRMLSLQTSPRQAYGKGNLDDEYAAGLLASDGSDLFATTRSSSSSATATATATASASKAAAGGNKSSGKQHDDKVVRHQDVVYQFSIFENQRWWVGLDWTAALLPQERPSWSDEANNPVSPPSSFSLPATKIMLTPETSGNAGSAGGGGKTFTRRTIKWQWVDAEWTIAGVSSAGSGYYSASTVYKGSAKDAAMKSASALGDPDALAAAKQGYLGDALNRIRARTGADKALEDEAANEVGAAAHKVDQSTEEWDVDADGWQYGDNAWDKMSRKSGMGRYTRRRKWVRRAVLLEVVEYGVQGPSPSPAASPEALGDKKQAELKDAVHDKIVNAHAEREKDKDKVDGIDVSTPPAEDIDVAADPNAVGNNEPGSPASPSLPRPKLSDRLAKAAK